MTASAILLLSLSLSLCVCTLQEKEGKKSNKVAESVCLMSIVPVGNERTKEESDGMPLPCTRINNRPGTSSRAAAAGEHTKLLYSQSFFTVDVLLLFSLSTPY